MKLERRQFMKLGVAASAGVATSGLFGVIGHSMTGRHVARTTSNSHSFVDSACRMCPAGCGIRAFIDAHNNLVTLAGIPDHPVNHGKICAKGLAAINLHYHPERLLSPLVAKAQRAQGFEGATHQRAIDLAASLIQKAKAANALFVVDTEDDDPEVYRTLFTLMGVNSAILNRPVVEDNHRASVDRAVFGHGHVQPDFAGARVILVFGANPFEGGPNYIAQARALIDARLENRAKLFVFDPVNTNTAGKADRWLPIRPGTDYIAAMYLLKKLGWTPGETEETESLTAGMTENNACEQTGLTPDDFDQVASAIGQFGATSLVIGGGVYDQPNAIATRTALALLEKQGKGEPVFAAVGDPDPTKATDATTDVYQQVESGDRPVFLITRRTNPVYEGSGESLQSALRDTERVIGHLSICPFVNETNRFADVVIPELLPLEDWGLVPASWHANRETWTLQQPIPKFPESIKSGYSTLMDIAAKVGMRGAVENLGMDHRARIQNRIKQFGLSFTSNAKSNLLIGAGGALPPEAPVISLSGLVPVSGFVDSKNKGMTLVVADTNVMNPDFARCKWLAEISHQNALSIHPDDARKLGVKQGDALRVNTSSASIVVSADLSFGVRPGVVSLATGFGHDYFGKVASGKRWRTPDDPDAWLIWWGQYGNGINANELTSGLPVSVKVVKA